MIKKIHFFIEYAVHYLKKYFLVVILGIFAGTAVYLEKNNLVSFYQSLQTKNDNIGIEGLYTPASLPSDVTKMVSDGFTVNNEKNEPTLSPLIAKLDIQNDNHTYLFTFKNNLYWQNGQKLNTNEISLNIPGASTVSKNATQFEIDIQDPYSPLLSLLTKPIFYKKTLIGLGSYKISSQTYQNGYLKTITLASIANHHQKITYHFYSNTQDLVNSFKLGEVDEINTDSLDDQITKWSNVKITPQITTDRYIAVFLNTEKLESKSVRQALAYATPKTTDKNDRCLGPISPNSWAYNEDVKQYDFDPQHAKELLATTKIDHLNLIVTDRKLLDVADSIKSNWEQSLNISVTISIEEGQIDLNSYNAILTYGQIPTDPDQYSFWHSTQSQTNITHLNNSRIDKLLEEGRQTFDQLARRQIYYDFQKFLLEESPAIFLKFPTTYDISRVK